MRTFQLALLRGATICSTKSRRDYTLELTADEFCAAPDTSLRPVIGADAANLMRLAAAGGYSKTTGAANRFQAKGRILLLDLADILAVEAEGNYVSLRHDLIPIWCTSPSRPWRRSSNPTVLFASTLGRREYSAVEEIQPLPTGSTGCV